MIYTVTFNPALDYGMRVDGITPGVLNRSAGEEITFGGKGINVSYVLSQLGVENTALGFIAGFSGEYLEDLLKKSGVNSDFIKLGGGFTRINVKLLGANETEINAKGPDIAENELSALTDKLERILPGDTLVLSGSIPKALPDNIYERILNKLSDKSARFVIDASGNLLINTLKYKPFLIKPNIFELEEIFGVKITSDKEIENAALRLKEMGAVNVLVSLGKEGALLADEFGKIRTVAAFPVKALNSVGAGDSMVAGFLAGIERGYDYALRLGAAAGAATAASNGLAKADEIMKLLN